MLHTSVASSPVSFGTYPDVLSIKLYFSNRVGENLFWDWTLVVRVASDDDDEAVDLEAL